MGASEHVKEWKVVAKRNKGFSKSILFCRSLLSALQKEQHIHNSILWTSKEQAWDDLF